jgi:LacI family transcriptional regulator
MTTIHDVAKSAGVSPITVSRVVNRLENVHPDTRARVEKAIKELGYVRNLAASSLRSKETYTLALILPDITNIFWTTIARGAEDAAQKDGYSVMLCNTDENPEKFNQYLDTVLQQRVDGVMLAPITTDSLHIAQLGDRKVPTVIVDRRLKNWDGDSVNCDSFASSEALVQHLVGLGHTQIAIISGPATTSTAEDRVAGYCMAMSRAGIHVNPGLILRGEYRLSSGQSMTQTLMHSGVTPTAIIATNNTIAAGVIEELIMEGKKIPDDMAVVSFDELSEMEHFFPFMTCVTQPAYEIGMRAIQLLISRIKMVETLPGRHVILPTQLIQRYSCGRFLKSDGPEAAVNFRLLPDLSTKQVVMPLDAQENQVF